MRAIGLLLLLAGCRQLLGFQEPTPGVVPDDSVVADMPLPPDAGACISLESSCAGDVLRECLVVGQFPVETTCGWGCIDGSMSPHCGVLSPSGGAVTSGDLTGDPNLLDVTVSAAVVIDANSGAMSGGVTRSPGTGIRDGIEFVLRGNVGVFRVKSIVFASDVTIGGTNAFVLIATAGDIAIGGAIDLTASCNTNSTPGGSTGGAPGNSGNGNGGGARGEKVGGGSSVTGGGGGGYGAVGGDGGDGATGGQGGTGGPVYGSDAITTLVGGSGGGSGASDPNGMGGRGGAGGGAIQLVSNARIAITGGINAGGCGGRVGTTSDSAGGGGGSGGTILLEAPVIELAGGLAVNGGGGGPGSLGGTTGANGGLDTDRAQGGVSNAGDGALGGASGTLNGANGQSGNLAGAGGGGVGRIRLVTRAGTITMQGGFTSPSLTDPATTATQAQATVQ